MNYTTQERFHIATNLLTYFYGTGNEPPPSAYPLECNTFLPWLAMLAHHPQIISSTSEQRVTDCCRDLGNTNVLVQIELKPKIKNAQIETLMQSW